MSGVNDDAAGHLGVLPHICKEVTWGTAVTPTRTIPFTKAER
jgi:hypothetical protein